MLNFQVLIFLLRTKIKETLYSLLGYLKWKFTSSGSIELTDDSRLSVVFVADKARFLFRLMRFAKWLGHQYPVDLYLISSDIRRSTDLLEEYRHCFKRCFCFRSRWEYRYVLKKYFSGTSIPFHVITPPNDLAKEILLNTRNLLFFDPYDVRVIYFGPKGEGCDISWMRRKWIEQDIPDEKIAFEGAHAHVCRSAENKTAIRKYFYKTHAPRIFMPDYCDPEYFEEKKPMADDGEIHIVYVGGVASRKAPPSFYSYMQLHNTIEAVTSRGIHFHVYYAPTQNDDLSDYESLAAENPLFHWHRPLPQKEMIREISRYHYGIIPFFKEEMGSISPDKFFASTSLKLFNYLEAGLPVLISCDLGHKSMIIRYYQAGIVISKNDLPRLDDLLKENSYASLSHNVLLAREKLSLATHVGRLYQLYRHVMEQYGNGIR